MPKLCFDTRFFIEGFFSSDDHWRLRAKEFVTKNKDRYVSVATLHEVYFLELTKKGRDVAMLRTQAIQDFFDVAGLDSSIAVSAAELRAKYRIPMGDSLIAATCRALSADCVTDDPHFVKIREIKTRWI
jgi:predicted nucleic acid-binding protein